MNKKVYMYSGIAVAALAGYNVILSKTAYGANGNKSGVDVLTATGNDKLADLKSAGTTFWLVQAGLLAVAYYLYRKG